MSRLVELNSRRRRIAWRREMRATPVRLMEDGSASADMNPAQGMDTPAPSQELLRKVRAGFTLQGTTLTEWCRANGTHISNARNALIGTWDGPKGRAMRARIVRAAGVRAAA